MSNLLLRGRQIVFYPQQFDEIALNVVNAVRRAPVTIAGLPHAAGVDEILPARLDANMLFPFLPDAALVPNEHHGHMRVAEETDRGALISETRDGVEVIKNVAPLPGCIECGVNDRKMMDLSL